MEDGVGENERIRHLINLSSCFRHQDRCKAQPRYWCENLRLSLQVPWRHLCHYIQEGKAIGIKIHPIEVDDVEISYRGTQGGCPPIAITHSLEFRGLLQFSFKKHQVFFELFSGAILNTYLISGDEKL